MIGFIGAVLGGFFWGWFADRYGRRLSGIGFFVGALSVVLYLTAFDSPGLARHLQSRFDVGAPVTVVIGGAYGVDARVHARADRVWSLSPLVFPHQLVRLILAEQVYRAQEISAGRPYHHA